MANASFLKPSSGGEPLTFNRYPLSITNTSSGLLHYQLIVPSLAL
jgi:hypothetical protein